jgi:hypothetical protein
VTRLSERLLELANQLDGACCPACDAKRISLLNEAAALAKRYEDAPAMSVSMVAEGHIVGLYLHPVTDASEAHELTGQRVRILLDTEGDHGSGL